MAGLTIAIAESKLESWLAADEKVATGQEYRIGTRWLTRADAKEIRANIQYWQNWIISLGNCGIKAIGVTPI